MSVGLGIIASVKWEQLQLVEDDDMIGTLIETNDRIIAALETYDTVRVFFDRIALLLNLP